MSGIPLAPWSIDADGCVAMLVRAQPDSATHIARRVPEDEAREAVVAAAEVVTKIDPWEQDKLERALNALADAWIALDALTKGDA